MCIRDRLSALASVTKNIGLVATGSTTYDEPYHVARRFASLDHISGGRAGWNIVTTSNPNASLNFGLEEALEHGDRYARAREFYDVVTGLWDSWDEEAFIKNKETGEYFDPKKLNIVPPAIPNACAITLIVGSKVSINHHSINRLTNNPIIATNKNLK